MSGTVAYEGGLESGILASAGVRGSAQVEAILSPAKWAYYLNYGEDSLINQVAARNIIIVWEKTKLRKQRPLIC